MYSFLCFRTINYGALGILMGHEVSHGFADSGEYIYLKNIQLCVYIKITK